MKWRLLHCSTSKCSKSQKVLQKRARVKSCSEQKDLQLETPKGGENPSVNMAADSRHSLQVQWLRWLSWMAPNPEAVDI